MSFSDISSLVFILFWYVLLSVVCYFKTIRPYYRSKDIMANGKEIKGEISHVVKTKIEKKIVNREYKRYTISAHIVIDYTYKGEQRVYTYYTNAIRDYKVGDLFTLYVDYNNPERITHKVIKLDLSAILFWITLYGILIYFTIMFYKQ